MLRRRLLPALGFLSLVLSASAAEPWIEVPPSASQPLPRSSLRERPYLRVASWNIEWFPAGQRKGAVQQENWQMAAVANLVNKIKPDILATQEIRNLASLEKLNRNIGIWPFTNFASSIFNQKNNASADTTSIRQQCGFLTRQPWQEIWEIDFQPLPEADRPSRGWLAARWAFGDGSFTLYNGHLQADSGKAGDGESGARLRLAAITRLKEDFERRNLDPYRDKIIVLGNFNADLYLVDSEKDKTFTALADLGFRMVPSPVKREDAITVPARKGVDAVPDRVLDYIWMSSGWKDPLPELQILQEGASMEKNVFGGDRAGLASDHYPVYIDIPIKR